MAKKMQKGLLRLILPIGKELYQCLHIIDIDSSDVLYIID